MLIKISRKEVHSLEKFDKINVESRMVEDDNKRDTRGVPSPTGVLTYAVYGHVGRGWIALCEPKNSEDEALQILNRIFSHTSGNLDLTPPTGEPLVTEEALEKVLRKPDAA